MEFVPYFTRPHSILGASLWDYWYRSDVFKNIFGFIFGDSVMYGIPAGASYVVHAFKRKHDLDCLKTTAKKLVISNPKICLDMLKEGVEIQHKVMRGEYKASDNVYEEYAKVTIYTAILPYFWFNQTDITSVPYHAEIQSRCVQLRARNVYTMYFNNVVVPYLSLLTGRGVKELEWCTYREIQNGYKRESTELDMGFVYTYTNGIERLDFKTESEIRENIHALKYASNDTEIPCTVLDPNLEPVQGIARLVAHDLSVFNDGEVLIVPSFNERYLSLMSKAKAIICEDGGVMAHVSYIQNLDIPVCTSAKDITVRVSSGDNILVEPGKFRVRLVHE